MPDPLTFEFDLNPTAMWQPGNDFQPRPVDAHDVVFSLERLRTPGFPHAPLLDSVERIEAVGDGAVRLALRYPDPDLPLKLASPYAVILASETLNDDGARDAPVVGAGPWLFRQAASGQVTLTAWDDHPAGTGLETVEFLIAGNPEVAARLLREGRVDAAHVPNELWPELDGGGLPLRGRRTPGQGRAVRSQQPAGALRQPRPPPRRVRRARPAGRPRRDLRHRLRAARACHLVDDAWRLDDAELRALLRRRADCRLRRAAVHPCGGQLRRGYTSLTANCSRSSCAPLGSSAQTKVVTRAEYLRRVWEERDFDAFVGPMPPIDAPNAFLLGLAHTEGASNVVGGDHELDALIEAVAVELDPDARADLARSVQRALIEGAYFVMAASLAERWALSPRIERFPPHMPMGAGDLWAQVRVAGGSDSESDR